MGFLVLSSSLGGQSNAALELLTQSLTQLVPLQEALQDLCAHQTLISAALIILISVGAVLISLMPLDVPFSQMCRDFTA